MAAAEEVKEAAATRSVLLAVDGSDHSKRAFDCKYMIQTVSSVSSET